jgi:resuscitation-promoting factor RpfA
MNNTSAIRRNVRRGAAALVLGGTAVGALALPANAAPASTWDALAECESGGNWNTSTGNGFSGGLQFTPSTWAAFGGTGSPESASREQQIAVAENVLDGQGWGAWPACSAELGLDRADAAGAPSRSGGREPVSGGAADRANGGTYTVRSGDTLGSIADAQGVSWRALWRVNSDVISDPNLIYVGEQLQLP